MTRKIALLIGNYRPTFVLAHSLKNRGYEVIAGLDGYDRGAEVSRYVDKVWKHASYQIEFEKFQFELTRFLKGHPEITDVYPVAEPVIRAVAEERLVLPDHIRVGTMDGALVQHCLDKRALLTQATELEIPVAPFAETTDHDDLYAQAERIGFPLVIRPLETGKLLGSTKAITCNNPDELSRQNEVWKQCDYRLLIQRQVKGKRDNIYFAAKDGEIFRYLHAKIIRTDQPDGSGLAVEGETVTPCPTIDGYTRILIKALNYDGIGCAQYLVDPESGDINFLELNPRIAGNHALPDACAMKLSDWLIDKTEGTERSGPPITGTTGLRYSWIAGELDAIRQSWRKGRLGFGQALVAGLAAFQCFRRDELDMGFVQSDPMPGVITLCDSLPLIGGITRRRFENPFLFKLFIRKECLK